MLAELADCYSLCGEDKFGKVLYREAFFADPDSIDLDFLDSELIKCLIEKTKSKGYSLRRWAEKRRFANRLMKNAEIAKNLMRIASCIFAMRL